MLRRRTPGCRTRTQEGFTLLEILIAMSLFVMLGGMVVVFLRQSLDIFYTGTRESAQLDRQDIILPQVRADLSSLALPASFQAPSPPPPEDLLRRKGMDAPPAARPELVRLRAGYVKLTKTGVAAFKDYPCYYIAFVVADANEGADRLRRRAGEVPAKGGQLKPLTPGTVGDRDARYLATGGLMEVVWIAVPSSAMTADDPSAPVYPAMLTLYRGFRTPIGDPERSLLNPANLDTPAKIAAACRPVARGLIHFGATWRRAFATGWDTELGVGLGEQAPYVGPLWDSSRAFEKAWPLFKGPESLVDPSDDLFPPFVRLEATLAEVTQSGPGRGEFTLRAACTADDTILKVGDVDILMQPNRGKERWLKVDSEWMSYTLRDVNYQKREVRVRRGMRGTKKDTHEAGAWCYVGTPAMLQMRLPVSREPEFVVREGRR